MGLRSLGVIRPRRGHTSTGVRAPAAPPAKAKRLVAAAVGEGGRLLAACPHCGDPGLHRWRAEAWERCPDGSVVAYRECPVEGIAVVVVVRGKEG